jgi:hypothetical protein
LDDSHDFDGLPDRFASPRQQARQAFSKQTNGAVPVTPQPYAQRQRWIGGKIGRASCRERVSKQV